MAKPAYIMMSNSGAVDRFTNEVSFFNAVETVEVIKDIPPATILALPKRRRDRVFIVATWVREETDADGEQFETQVECTDKNGDVLFTGEPAIFEFRAGIQFHRFVINDLALMGYKSLGAHIVEARLRKVGEQEWSSRQHYTFVLKERTDVVQDGNASDAPPEGQNPA